MVLADTSVWVDHLRKDDEQLAHLLEQNRVCCHPMIIGELACGNLRQRDQLMGKGTGYVGLHLLASTLLSLGTSLWTFDKRLQGLAAGLGVGLDTPQPADHVSSSQSVFRATALT